MNGLEPLVDLLVERTSMKLRVRSFLSSHDTNTTVNDRRILDAPRLSRTDERLAKKNIAAGELEIGTDADTKYNDGFIQDQANGTAYGLTRDWLNRADYVLRSTGVRGIALDEKLIPITPDKRVQQEATKRYNQSIRSLCSDALLTPTDARKIVCELNIPLREYLMPREYQVLPQLVLSLRDDRVFVHYS